MAEPDLSSILKEAHDKLQLNGQKRAILIVGETGTGKTTLVKYILKAKNLKVIKSEYTNTFVDEEKLIGSNPHVSRTTHPNIFEDSQSGQSIVDLAGFLDVRDPKIDLTNAFLSNLVYENIEQAKIIIVVDYNYFNLLDTIQLLAKTISNDQEIFKRSVALVATKVDACETEERIKSRIKNHISNAMEKLVDEIEEESDEVRSLELRKQSELIKYLDTTQNIGFFKTPRAQGDPWMHRECLESRQQLRDLLFDKVQYTQATQGTFSVSVTPSTMNFIRERQLRATNTAIEEIFSKLANEQQTKFEQGLLRCKNSLDSLNRINKTLTYCREQRKFLADLKNLNTVEELNTLINISEDLSEKLNFQLRLKLFFQSLINKIESLLIETVCFQKFNKLEKLVSDSIDIYDFLSHFSSDFDSYMIRRDFDPIEDLAKNFNEHTSTDLSRLLMHGFSANTIRMANNVVYSSELISEIRRLIVQKKPRLPMKSEEGTTLIYQSQYIIISKILDGIKLKEDVTHVVIIGVVAIYFDADIDLQHTHLTLLTPKIEIVEQSRRIKMTGLNASAQEAEKAPKSTNPEPTDANGKDGHADNFSSGNLKIYALKVKGDAALNINSFGGGGGDGQHGGDGFDAVTPPSPNDCGFSESYTDRDTLKKAIRNKGYSLNEIAGSQCTTIIPLVLANAVKLEEKIRVTNEQPRVPPGNGGRGGNASPGAEAGTQEFFFRDTAANANLYNSRLNGNHGTPGNGGKAGMNAPSGSFVVYHATFDLLTALIVPIWNARMDRRETGQLNTLYDPANDGENGTEPLMHVIRYKYQEDFDLGRWIRKYELCMREEGYENVHGSDPHAFLEYLRTLVH